MNEILLQKSAVQWIIIGSFAFLTCLDLSLKDYKQAWIDMAITLMFIGIYWVQL